MNDTGVDSIEYNFDFETTDFPFESNFLYVGELGFLRFLLNNFFFNSKILILTASSLTSVIKN
jgi:hypothetical protein